MSQVPTNNPVPARPQQNVKQQQQPITATTGGVDHVLSHVSRPREQVQNRVNVLNKEFGSKFKFAIRENDNRFDIVIENWVGGVEQPILDRMRSIASGHNI